jgi:hypothetical protein
MNNNIIKSRQTNRQILGNGKTTNSLDKALKFIQQIYSSSHVKAVPDVQSKPSKG